MALSPIFPVALVLLSDFVGDVIVPFLLIGGLLLLAMESDPLFQLDPNPLALSMQKKLKFIANLDLIFAGQIFLTTGYYERSARFLDVNRLFDLADALMLIALCLLCIIPIISSFVFYQYGKISEEMISTAWNNKLLKTTEKTKSVRAMPPMRGRIGFFAIGVTNFLQFIAIMLILMDGWIICIDYCSSSNRIVIFGFWIFMLDLLVNVIVFFTIFSLSQATARIKRTGMILTGVFAMLSLSFRQTIYVFLRPLDPDYLYPLPYLSSLVFGAILLMIIRQDPLLESERTEDGKLNWSWLKVLLTFVALCNIVFSPTIILSLFSGFSIILKILLPLGSAPLFIWYGSQKGSQGGLSTSHTPKEILWPEKARVPND